MFQWPSIELTDWERKFVRPYSTEVRNPRTGAMSRLPGVLKRVYPLLLSNDTAIGLPSGPIQISRRSRVFGLMFSGDISHTRLGITNASGTTYIIPDARTGLFPPVSAMIAASPYMDGSKLGVYPDSLGLGEPTSVNQMVHPFLIDPNWILMPNETLIFNGTFDVDSGTASRIMRIGVHVWEFPGMGNADKQQAEML